ncbi:MAG: YjbQ family protein [Bermanella sp.]
MWVQKEIELAAKPYGFHLITDEFLRALPEISELKIGLIHVMLKHTSAGITLNENADKTVRSDFLGFMNRLVPQGCDYFEHNDEGLDDMPAHIKSSLIGAQLTIPISNGRLNLGVWQGIYLGEFRKSAGNRQLLVTINGDF